MNNTRTPPPSRRVGSDTKRTGDKSRAKPFVKGARKTREWILQRVQNVRERNQPPRKIIDIPKRGEWFTFSTRDKSLRGILNAIKVQPRADTFFLCIVIILLAFGLVMMFSAGYIDALSQTNNAYTYIISQGKNALIGIVAMIIFANINPKVFRKISYIALAGALGLLVLVLFYYVNLGPGREDIKRFIPMGSFTFQPSEIAKLALIMFCAADMALRRDNIMRGTAQPRVATTFRRPRRLSWFEKAWNAFSPMGIYVLVIGAMAFLIYKENHLSGTILILTLGAVMMFLGGVKLYWYLFPAGGLAVFVLGYMAEVGVVRKFFASYMEERITAWLDKSFEPLGARWQVNQSLYAIGSGGLFGQGFGQSQQKHLYVSEPH
ncbi:MAG: FtsW/RodA/SpoVE family cell cycle protein, partial [Oscillospiraceae bacterium]|nr:FtsW/RodA/SpoVE family cell cycle protein [Oscillospiraceae bacterium]